MNLPKNLKIGGRVFKIIYPHTFKERNLYGEFSVTFGTIKLANKGYAGNKLCDDTMEVAFWHEVIHAIDEIYSDSNLKEKDVIHLGEGLFQVLKDNFIIKPK